MVMPGEPVPVAQAEPPLLARLTSLATRSELDKRPPRTAGQISASDLTFQASFGSLWNDLDQLGERIDADAEVPDFVIGSAAGFTTSLSVGYVVWLIRGGHILAGLMAQLPAWRFIDPLPILGALADDDDYEAYVVSLQEP